ncbi:uncharacterized protein phf11 isoform X2 [Dunckerocampus dactyliophorus]|uniref:uncharacterized protein phf11 isoform X2 n=1 Tax=Dunckerocampus dactyliophorus TaxID=161453 RepID=UPI002405621D|nr:uncharacterized protein phf11 isoform X2 [Dunckerocampus dactyliophorus]
MPPKSSTSSKVSGKRQKKVMTLQEKVALLDMLTEGRSYAAVARHYGMNESTVRYIKKKEADIRNTVAVSSVCGSAKTVSTVRDKGIVMMESALAVWITECSMNSIALDGKVIREKARELYKNFTSLSEGANDPKKKETGPSSAREGFQASSGWFDRFKKRFQLCSVSLHGEAASTDTKITDEIDCRPEQVFNMDEPGLVRKKIVPSRTYLIKDAAKELFSSGIYCKDSPQFDDLFGFSVEDVETEVKRGNKLCAKCKKSGATVGCEVDKCKRCYHYPCAIEGGAEPVVDGDRGEYVLFCFEHSKNGQKRKNGPTNKSDSVKSGSTTNSKEPFKFCPTCEKEKGNINLECSSLTFMLYCDKHSMASNKKGTTSGDLTAAYLRPDSYLTQPVVALKRHRVCTNKQADAPPKRKRQSLRRKIQNLLDSSYSGDEEPSQLFAPIEDSDSDNSSDLASMDQSVSCTVLPQSVREDEVTSAGSYKEHQTADVSGDEDPDAESQSLFPLPKELPAMSPAPPTAAEATDGKDKGTPPALDPGSFWRSCNAAGCTQAIFMDLIMEMSNISTRIQSDQASQEDYDTALKVMMASGKLTHLVKKQKNALKGKQMELQKSLAAMQEVESALMR